MPDHLHAYNIAVKDARTTHRKAVEEAAARRIYERSIADASYRRGLASAAEQYRRAMTAAEDAYDKSQAAADGEPPF